ncbi:expressed unknown protein [Seminavis robusta]|uniref:Uncharacterized protein n=1 Tax=Seminavis robusta TaxID=568900 RepID=A0A9N8DQE0_9STRA|nr:expressed unknown protein [Seminavis robusta]|eukprot:Sro209_g087460.1 n/a (283) ;mRNA; f:81067-81915
MRGPWFAAKGGKPYLDIDEVGTIASGLCTNQGSSLGYGQIETSIAKTRKKRLEDKGLHVLLEEVCTPSKDTVRNYGGALAMLSGNSCTSSKVVHKKPTRKTAENSIRSALDFAGVVSSTHYMITEKEIPEVRTYLNEKATASEKKIYNTISDLHDGAPLLPVKKAFILSSDDTTEWLVEGMNKYNIHKFDTRSLYHSTNEAMATEIRVKLSITMTAAGVTAPLFISITGLTDRELVDQDDNDSGVIVFEIPGLSIGGGGVTASNRDIGYLVLLQQRTHRVVG